MPDTEDTRITPETGALYYVVNGLPVPTSEVTIETSTVTTATSTVAGHVHEMSDVNGLLNALSGKASTQHTHEISNINNLTTELAKKADAAHHHNIDDITNLTSTLLNKASISDLNTKAPLSHNHTFADVLGLNTEFAKYANIAYVDDKVSTKANLTDLVDKASITQLNNGLAAKASITHTHGMSDVSGLVTKLSSIDSAIATLSSNLANIPTNTTIVQNQPIMTSPPVITGVNAVTKKLSVNVGIWTNSPTTYFFQIRKTDGVNETILGSLDNYTPTDADAYSNIFAYVLAVNQYGAAVAKTASTQPIVPAPVFTTIPSITGVFAVGNTLSVTYPTQLYTTYTVEWLRNNVSTGVTSSSYTTASSDIGQRITCKVTATNIAGTISSTSSSVYIVDFPKNLYAPAIDSYNITANNQVLASAGGWVFEPTFAYQWKLNGSNIAGATSKYYTIKSSDVGSTLSFTVVATNAKGSVTLTSPGVVVGPYKELVDIVANPITRPHIGNNKTYNVGPGYDYDTPDLVPWGALVAGDSVNIFYQSAPYKYKIGLRGQGTQESPITVNGVTDANGNRPILDFSAAQTALGSNMGGTNNVFNPDYPEYGEGLGGIVIKRGTKDEKGVYQPKWIQLKNLQVQGARNGSTYKTWFYGGTGIYNASAGVYIVVGEDFLLENLVVTNNGFGIFTQSKDGVASETCKRVIIRNCKIYGNGVVDSFLEHGIYNQGISPIVEYCYLGTNRPGSTGSSYKSRASGEIFRYNWVVSHARTMDFVHSEDSVEGVSAQTDYPVLHVYGNVIVNDDTAGGASYAPIHFGGDNLGEDAATGPLKNPLLPYRNKMYFYNNTYFCRVDQASSLYTFLFDLSLAGTETTPRTTVYAWNNVFYATGTTAYSWTRYVGDVKLLSNNVIYGSIADAKYDATAGRYSVTKSSSTYNLDPLFVSYNTYDFGPSANSPLIDKTPTSFTLPDSFKNLTVKYSPHKQLNGADVRPSNGSYMDIGAYELDPLLPMYTSGITLGGSNIPMNSVTVTSTGAWSITGVFTYQWYKNGVQIDGATNSSYQIQYTDASSTLYCVITNTANGKSTSAKSPTITVADDPRKPVNSTLPVISTDYYVGSTASITNGSWTNSPTAYSYSWSFTDGTTSTIIGSTQEITLPKTAIGKTLVCSITATNSFGNSTIKVNGSIVKRNTIYDPDSTNTYNFSLDDGTLISEIDQTWVYGSSAFFETVGGYARVLAAKQSFGTSAYRNTGTAKQNISVTLKAGFTGTFAVFLGATPEGGNSHFMLTVTPTTWEIRSNNAWQGNGSYTFSTTVDSTIVISNDNGVWTCKVNGVSIGSSYNLGDNLVPYAGFYMATTDNTKLLLDKFRDY